MRKFFVELRHEADTRILRGIAMPYGQPAKMPWGEERFEAGAFGDVSKADVILNVQHDRGQAIARTDGGGLVLTDSPQALRISRYELPETRAMLNDVLLTKVRDRESLRGFSVEFRAIKERFEGATRIIERAALKNIGIVDRPAYSSAYIEARVQEIEKDAGDDNWRRNLWRLL